MSDRSPGDLVDGDGATTGEDNCKSADELGAAFPQKLQYRPIRTAGKQRTCGITMII